jgi:hypothetical protein
MNDSVEKNGGDEPLKSSTKDLHGHGNSVGKSKTTQSEDSPALALLSLFASDHVTVCQTRLKWSNPKILMLFWLC